MLIECEFEIKIIDFQLISPRAPSIMNAAFKQVIDYHVFKA